MPELKIKVTSDTGAAGRDLEGLGSKMEALALPAAAVTAAVAAMGADVVASASEAQQAAGALEAVFGSATAAMTSNAQGAADSVGLAESEYSQLAAVMGAQLGNMGVATDELAGTTDGLIGVGADLAAQFGGSTAEAVEALSSLMRGERDPIERYGVSISDAAIQAQKAEMGLAGLTGEADRAATTQATLALLTEQTASSQGAFARETNTAAGAAQIANATWENSKAALGEKLLPAVTAITQAFTGMAAWVGQNSTVVLVLVGVVGALAAGVLLVNGAMITWRAAVAVAAAAQWLWNAAMSANPLGLIILAIAAVIAIIVLLVQNWDTVKRVALAVWAAVSDAVARAAAWLQDKFNTAVNAVVRFFTGLRDRAAAAARAIADGASRAAQALQRGWNNAINAVARFFTGLRDRAASIVSTIANANARAAQALQRGWNSAVNAVTRFFTNLGSSAKRVVDRIIGWFSAIPRRVMGFFNNIRIPDWIGNALGFLGLSAPATELTMTYNPASATFAAGGAWAAPTPHALQQRNKPDNAPIQITVQGALDPVAVARQIRDLINTDARRRGVISLTGKALP